MNPTNDLFLNKNCFIAGGSTGIGFSLAKKLVQSGANVHILARTEASLKNAVQDLQSYRISPDQKIGYLIGDVSDPEKIRIVLSDFQHEHGTPDFLFNCAGVVHPGRFEELSLEKFRWMVDINYLGSVYVISAFLPAMLARKTGHIINIGSGASFLGIYGYTAYSGSKFAIRGMSDALRSEIRPYNIALSIVYPPDTQTPQLEYEEKYKPAITKEISGVIKPLSAEWVAEKILAGVKKRKYVIIPDFQTRLLYRLNSLLGDGAYRVMDWMVDNAIRKHGLPKVQKMD